MLKVTEFQLYGNGKSGNDMPSRGTQNQLHVLNEKTHVQQFIGTEVSLNKAVETRSTCQKLLKSLYGSADLDPAHLLGVGGTSMTMSSLRQLELDVWAKEREASGLKASLTTLKYEVQWFNMLCEERREAEDSLKKKWKKIEESDAQRLEINSIYSALLSANMDAPTFWTQQPLAARNYASSSIIPACNFLIDI
ncbi:hypothetical protein R6Q57_016072 [Mikania cordata]